VVWGGNDGAAMIEFNERGRVSFKHWTDSPETWLQKLARWLTW